MSRRTVEVEQTRARNRSKGPAITLSQMPAARLHGLHGLHSAYSALFTSS